MPKQPASEILIQLGVQVGHAFAPSDWFLISQQMICDFGLVSHDPDPMHINPEWAAVESPFGKTIAFGFLTVSLLTALLHSALKTGVHVAPSITGVYLNYGFERLRLVEPVPVNARIRGRFILRNVATDRKNRCIVTFDCTIDIEGVERPALVANWLTIWVPPTL